MSCPQLWRRLRLTRDKEKAEADKKIAVEKAEKAEADKKIAER
jgi:hypothetical protein